LSNQITFSASECPFQLTSSNTLILQPFPAGTVPVNEDPITSHPTVFSSETGMCVCVCLSVCVYDTQLEEVNPGFLLFWTGTDHNQSANME